MNTKYNRLSVPQAPALEMEFYHEQSEKLYNARVYPPHVHDCLEVYVLEEGDVSFLVESSLYKLEPYDAIVCKPNEIHNCVLNSAGKHAHFCFWFDVTDERLYADLLLGGFGKNNLVRLSEDNKRRLSSVCKDLTGDTSDNKRFYRALELIDLLSGEKNTATSHDALPPLLKKILQDANEHFTEISSLDYFTEKYFVSTSTLNRLFNKYLNSSPKLYLETKRLAYSRKLLREGKSVFEACMQAGFSDYSNYIRLFKKRFGSTPKHYKEGKLTSDIPKEYSNNIYR